LKWIDFERQPFYNSSSFRLRCFTRDISVVRVSAFSYASFASLFRFSNDRI
jgi:hypothetical protein